MVIVFEQVFILLFFCTAGYLLSKGKLVNADHSKMLSVLEVYVFLPCVSFNTFATRFNTTYLQEKYPLVLVSLGLLAVLVIGAKIVSRFFAKEDYLRRVYEYTLTIPNFGYIGYALAEGIFGTDVLLDVMIFALPLSFYCNTVGYMMLTSKEGNKGFSWKRALNPPTICTIIGCIVGLSGVTIPSVLAQIAQKGAACMSPVSMLLTGMVISQFDLKELLKNKKVYMVTLLRLLVIPAFLFVLLKLTNLTFALTAVIMVYAMPCGMNTIIFPRLVGQDCKTGASLVLIGTVLSLITIPLCVYFLIPG